MTGTEHPPGYTLQPHMGPASQDVENYVTSLRMTVLLLFATASVQSRRGSSFPGTTKAASTGRGMEVALSKAGR